jgi:small subunit ribosomal protein S9
VAEEKEVAGTTETGGKESPAPEEAGEVQEQPVEASPAAEEAPSATAAEAEAATPEGSVGDTAEEASGAEEVAAARMPAEDRAEPEPSESAARVPTLDELGARTDVYYYGTGRRKTSSAQVRLYPSKEPAITVNDKTVDEYFSRPVDIMVLRRPLRATATEDMFRITVKVKGGGITGQAGAVRHGIARALTQANPQFRSALRREGSLTRDPRMKERKKPGLKRARKAPQYTKR